MPVLTHLFFFFFFNDTATTEIYTLSLHDALPICLRLPGGDRVPGLGHPLYRPAGPSASQLRAGRRSEEHTSELQSQSNLVCRLLLEKKKKNRKMKGQRAKLNKQNTSENSSVDSED